MHFPCILQHALKDRKIGNIPPFPAPGLFYLFRGHYMYIFIYKFIYLDPHPKITKLNPEDLCTTIGSTVDGTRKHSTGSPPDRCCLIAWDPIHGLRAAGERLAAGGHVFFPATGGTNPDG